MTLVDYTDELLAGWIIFPLYPINRTADGVFCGCLNPDCEAIGKHPRASNWQHTQPYDPDQLAYLEDENDEFFGNQLINNHGVVVASSGLLVVDVDGRNGGFESAKKLAHIREQAKYIVLTGSGFGEHWYFSIPKSWKGKALSTTLQDYPGIDFKSSGFVVGVGSEHASGDRYEALRGTPSEVGEAPEELLKQLERPERERFVFNGTTTDYSIQDLRSMVEAIPPKDNDYWHWLSVGMALHSATRGGQDGYEIWDAWSTKHAQYDQAELDVKWHSFGKSKNEKTVGTLIHMALSHGWQAPVTFTDNTDWGEISLPEKTQVLAKKHDLLKPPGLVGEIAQWINSRSLYPREHLAVAAALQIVSNAASLNFLVAEWETSLNLITLGIAGSRTGKGAIKKCMNEANRAMGLSRCEHGKFKSSQELIRNAIDHQLVIYTYDEFGEQLKKLGGAERGGAHYLVDLIAVLIEMYSEATGVLSVSGDLKRELMEKMDKQIAAAVKREALADDVNPLEYAKQNPDSDTAKALLARARAEDGITEPILNFFGLSEPVSFHSAINSNRSLLTGGFMGRSLIFEELETVPVAKDPSEVKRAPIPEHILMQLRALASGGSSEVGSGRIERKGDWQYIRWSDEARATLKNIHRYWNEVAVHERDIGSGLESQALGAAELAIKVAGILGAAKREISAEDMGWAHELVKRVTHMKINKAKADDSLESASAEEKGDGLLLAIMTSIENADKELTLGVLKQRVPGGRKMGDGPIQSALDYLVQHGKLKVDHRKGKNGRTFAYYSLA